jgi:hypothetical protein
MPFRSKAESGFYVIYISMENGKLGLPGNTIAALHYKQMCAISLFLEFCFVLK